MVLKKTHARERYTLVALKREKKPEALESSVSNFRISQSEQAEKKVERSVFVSSSLCLFIYFTVTLCHVSTCVLNYTKYLVSVFYIQGLGLYYLFHSLLQS